MGCGFLVCLFVSLVSLVDVAMLERPPPKPPPRSRQDLRRQRDRAYRQRVKEGRKIVPVEVSPEVEDWLIRIRWLTETEADAGNARTIGERIAAGLAASAKG